MGIVWRGRGRSGTFETGEIDVNQRAERKSARRIGALLWVTLAVAGPVHAATWVVDTTTDDGGLSACTAAAGDCSLRGAIVNANAAGGSNTITFEASAFNPGTITLSSALSVNADLSIEANGNVTISGNNASGLFSVQAAAVGRLTGLTLTAASGAAVSNNGMLVVSASTISGSVSPGNGGGIYNSGTLVLLGSTLSGNSADRGGGIATANSATTTLVNSTVTGNSATSGGGGVFAGGVFTLINSTISNNGTSGNGDGIRTATGTNLRIDNSIIANGTGSGIDCSLATSNTLTLRYSLIEDGSCGAGGGGNGNLSGDPNFGALTGEPAYYPLNAGSAAVNSGSNALAVDQDGSPLGFDQAGGTRIVGGTVDMGAFERGNAPNFVVDNTTDFDLGDCAAAPNDCSLRGAIHLANLLGGTHTISFDPSVFGTAQTITLYGDLPAISATLVIDGPGPSKVTVDGAAAHRVFTVNTGANATFRALTIANGNNANGGVAAAGGITNTGTATVIDCLLDNNSSESLGGGIYNNGTLVVKRSTIRGGSAFFGGGIYGDGGPIKVINSTLSGNFAPRGGGIHLTSGTITVINSTIAGNEASNPGAGIKSVGGTVDLVNTIVADNTGGSQCNTTATINAIHTLIQGNLNCVTGTNSNNLTSDPLLGVLADHGGPTPTMALPFGSPAIDAGDDTLAVDENSNPLISDQRGSGYDRSVGGRVDMGAYEAHDLLVDTVSDADLQDCSSAPDDCSLRGAINLANTLSGGTTIRFDGSVFVPATITLTSDLPPISRDMDISGPGHNKVILFGTSTYHAFTVAAGVTASITGMSISYMTTSGSGGGITNHGTLTMSDVWFSHTGAALNGGGIYNSSTGTLALSDGNFIQTTAASGGGLYSEGPTTVTDTRFFDNSSTSDGGAIALSGPGVSLTVGGGSVLGSSSAASGGAIHIANGSSATVSGTTFTNNASTFSGGAIHVASDGALALGNSVLSGSHTTDAGSTGGAIFNEGSLTVVDTTFSGNSTPMAGGALNNFGVARVSRSTFSGNTAERGGAINVNSDGTLNLVNATVTGNTADYGAGIFVGNGSARLTNSSVASNTGDGIFINLGTIFLYNSILAGNGGGGATNCGISGSAAVHARNTLIEDGLSCVSDDLGGNLTGDPLLGSLSDHGGPTQTMALLPGSPAIDAGSDALAVDADSNPLATDQRGAGFPRIVLGSVDMGAYEYTDVSAPVVTGFSAPSPTNTLDIPITTFTATDDIGVTGYLVTETSTPPDAGDSGWTITAPTAHTVAADGSYTLYPWVKDAAGNVSATYATPVSVIVDTAVPTVTAFAAPSTTNTVIIPITSFAATDANAITGYLITQSATPPAAGAPGWNASVPFTYLVAGDGNYTLYPWAKDAAGNVSAVYGSPAHVRVDGQPPSVAAFAVSSPSTSLAVPITSFLAFDNFSVTGYLITESATQPAANAAGWSGTAPSTFLVGGDGHYTLFPWVKDAAGNVSPVYGSPASVDVDTVLPTVTDFVATSPSTSLDITIAAFTALDNIEVTGYRITESATPPAAGDPGWVGTAPTTYTVAADGSYTLYPWVRDAAGNVSTTYGSPASVDVDTTPPALLSITRLSPMVQATSADVLIFRATFSEPVQGVAPLSFTVIGGSSAAVSAVSTPDSVSWDFTVSGGDLAGFNGGVGLLLAGSQGITDDVGNPLPDVQAATSETYIETNARVCYVDGSVPGGADDGSSWGDAYVDLQSALIDTQCSQVWVATGVYKPSLSDRAVSFTIRPGVAVYGGFTGTETDVDQRVPAIDTTVLSGDIDNNDCGGSGCPDGIDTDQSQISGSNSYHVVLLDGRAQSAVPAVTATTVLDGFTITAGNASQSTEPAGYGGGLLCIGSGSGAECSPSLRRLGFIGNKAQAGGALGNYAKNGIGLATLTDITFSGNRSNAGGALANNGAAGNASPSLVNVTFVGNSASNVGGAIYNAGTSLGTSSPMLVNVTFTDNHAPQGGAIYNNAAEPSLTNVILWGDAAGSGPEIKNGSGASAIASYSVIAGGCPAGTTCDNTIDTDPLLDVLADNGGFTRTIALLLGSTAVDAGSNGTCPAADQRGVARPQGPLCDIGAYEWIDTDTIFVDGFD